MAGGLRSVSIHGGITFTCPFCGGEVRAGEDRDSKRPCIIHSLSTCDRFEQLEPADFLRACRIARGN